MEQLSDVHAHLDTPASQNECANLAANSTDRGSPVKKRRRLILLSPPQDDPGRIPQHHGNDHGSGSLAYAGLLHEPSHAINEVGLSDDNEVLLCDHTEVKSLIGVRRRPRNEIAPDLPPLHDIEEIFEVAVKKAFEQGLEDPIQYFEGRSIRAATMCSGTESPLLALKLISKALHENFGKSLIIDHIFSAEIVPFKQAYIERNFHPQIIFRDVRELSKGSHATTAYGNVVPIPPEIDLLVAGTSCVDFSRLNLHGKKLADLGESGDTFKAFIRYIAKYRPAICLLENVQSAPWDEIRGVLMNNLGALNEGCRKEYEGVWEDGDVAYAAKLVHLDTKDYYIPQTRQRGYMIAIDSKRHKDAEAMVEAWAIKLDALKQKASSPVESFLSDDITNTDVFKSTALPNGARSEPDWDLCFSRYQDYRILEGLGSRRPLTQWVKRGSCTGPDHWKLDWARAQVERIWDTLDICHLRNAKRGFDDCYKTRMIELSQNIDRAIDSHGHGFVGCLTPSGFQFITTRGRPLMGREALRLQGLPIHKMLLTRETEKELLDLAGNAMTTTVVGSAILAALIVGYKTISINDRPPYTIHDASIIPIGDMKSDALLPMGKLDLAQHERCTLNDLRSMAMASTSLCSCEGRTLSLKRLFKSCKQCGHTACEKCAGTPRHDYVFVPKFQLDSRIEPSTFIGWVTKHLPMRVQLVGFDVSGLENLYANYKSHLTLKGRAHFQNTWKIYREAIGRALGEELRYETATRSKQWIVRYDAPSSYLELTIGEIACWRIYAKPDRQEPNNSHIRQLLKHPFARMYLKPGEDFLAGEWEFCLPVFLQCSLKIIGFGAKTKSWESHLGIQIKQPSVDEIYSKIRVTAEGTVCQHVARTIDNVVGEYELLEECGNASRSLHRRVNPSTGSPVYFFLDPHRIGPPEDDQFVFSKDHHRLVIGDTRELVAYIDPRWRQGRADMEKVWCQIYGLWEACGATLQVFNGCSDPTYAVPRKDPQVSIAPGITLDPDLSAQSQTCSAETMTFLSCQVPLRQLENVGWQSGPWRQVDQENEALALQAFSWLVRKPKDLDQFSAKWRRISLPCDTRRCQSCSPTAPAIKWRQLEQVKGPSAVVPYEDERQAGAFERAIKARATPFVTQTRIDSAVNGGFIGHVKVGINISALAHRVLSKTPFEFGRPVELSWRLNTTYEWPLEVVFGAFSLKDNKNGKEEGHVFVDDQGPNKSCVKLGMLRKEQRRSLWWMKQQESEETPPFLEQEIEEAYLPSLGWLAETVAKYPSHARGGVLADEVGYGKTATTLALIDLTMKKDFKPSEDKIEGGISIKATLIIVPGTLISQWQRQITKFLGNKYAVLKIGTVKDLARITVADLKGASIVLINWRVLSSEAYHKKLCALAAMPECSASGGRPYETWLMQAVKRMDDHAKELNSCNDIEAFGQAIDERITIAEQNNDGNIPSKRLRGAAYEAQAQINKKGSPELKVKIPVQRVSILKTFSLTQGGKLLGMKCPPLQLFNFHRIVIDEYTYLTDQELKAISSLRATNRWVLSGTPNMVDFAEIKLLASLLKVNLGVDDDAPNALKKSSIAQIRGNRTSVEQFRSFVEVHSPEWHTHRFKHAQKFLDHFARKNTAEIEEIQAVEMLRPVSLSTWERAIFMELQQQLHMQETRLSFGSSNRNDGDRVKRMRSILRTSKSPEEALLQRCSHFDSEDFTSITTDKSQNPCELIIRKRQAEYQDVCTELGKNLRHVEWLQKQLERLSPDIAQLGYVDRWRKSLNDDRDPEGTRDLARLLEEAGRNYRLDHQDEFYRERQKRDVMAREMAELKKGRDAAKKASLVEKRAKEALSRPKKRNSKSCRGSSAQITAGRANDGGQGVRVEGLNFKNEETPEAPILPDRRLWMFDLKSSEAIINEIKPVVSHVRKLVTELLSRRRSLRFLSITQEFQLWQCQMGPPPTCCGCNILASNPSDTFVLGICGHVACTTCLKYRDSGVGCVTQGCSSVADPQHIHLATDFAAPEPVVRSYGTKLDSIISLISDVTKHDQVLLFVQFEPLLDVICRALEASDIGYYSISHAAVRGVASMLTDFQENVSEDKKRVLILNPSNESAAGLNLVNANHVIFISPLLAESQHAFNESRIQCVGRARRYGQTKKVHVYDFLALHTIDVDITQDQRCKHLVREKLATGEDNWKLMTEEEMTAEEKAQDWASGWKRKDSPEE